MTVHVGTSGWSYDDWDGVLYPDGTPPAKRLGAYVQRYDTVELNSSYYHWPVQKTFAGWQTRLPERFLMSVKAPRELTHYKRLYAPEGWLERIVAGLTALAHKTNCNELTIGRLRRSVHKVRYWKRWMSCTT